MSIFGQKDEMMDMTVYWDDDVNINDIMDDLNRIGQYMTRTDAFKKGCRIVTVRNSAINDRLIKEAELYVDKKTEKWIVADYREGRFKAVKGTDTIVKKIQK